MGSSDSSHGGSTFSLCSGENLSTDHCPESSESCEFKAKICVVDSQGKRSEIRYDTIHK